MPSHPKSLMLFAAGLGTRMGPLTLARPKPMIEVAGKPLIDHALAMAERIGTIRVVVNLNYLPTQIRRHLSDRPNIAFSDETETILETGGGLRKALPLLGPGPVYTLNTDAVWTGENPLVQLRDAWDSARMDGLMLLAPKARATGHIGAGDFDMTQDGHLSRGREHVYTGAQILKTDGLAGIGGDVFSLNRLWDLMLARRRLFGIVHSGGWCDVGRPEAIELAELLLREADDV